MDGWYTSFGKRPVDQWIQCAQQMPRDIERARVSIQGEEIVRTYGGEDWLLLMVSDIKVIGELTNDLGPFSDGYFLILVTSDTWHEFPMSDDGMDELLIELSTRIGSPLKSVLADSKAFGSRIMWPEALSEHVLFVAEPARAKNILERIRFALFPVSVYRLGEEVREYAGIPIQ